MVRLLVKATPNTYETGDVITIKPHGWVWGKKETLPRFYQIDVEGVEYEQIKHLLEAHEVNSDLVRRRAYSIKVNELPSALESTGHIFTAWSQIEPQVENKITGLRGK